MHPGELLADVLPATGKTITEVADLIGISRQMLSMIVNGHARVWSAPHRVDR
jgi:plasmid maintenance system antidote protein VapI